MRASFALAGALALAIASSGAPAQAQADPAVAETPDAGGINARYLLMDAKGRAVTDQDFPGRFQLISFGYVSCPDVCPTTLAQMAAILAQLGAQAARVQPLFVTVDPERDTPDILRQYAASFDARIVALTGSAELIRRAADHFNVRYEKVREPGAAAGAYAVDHTAGMFLLGPDGRFIAKFAYATPPAQVVARLRALIERLGTLPAAGRRASGRR